MPDNNTLIEELIEIYKQPCIDDGGIDSRKLILLFERAVIKLMADWLVAAGRLIEQIHLLLSWATPFVALHLGERSRSKLLDTQALTALRDIA